MKNDEISLNRKYRTRTQYVSSMICTIENRVTVATWVFVILIFAVFSVFLFGTAMNAPFIHDESVYCTAGVLTGSGLVMYRDFAYQHMPWLPLLYGLLFKLTSTTNYLWWGRLFSVLCSVGTMALIFEACRRNISGPSHKTLLWGVFAISLYAANPQVREVSRYAWNYMLPMLCLMVAFVLLTDAMKGNRLRSLTVFVIGIHISLAVFTRLNFAPAAAAIGIATIALASKQRKLHFTSTLTVLLAGACLPSLLALYYFAKAPSAFFLHTFRYFIMTGSHQWMPGWTAAIKPIEKWTLFQNTISTPSFLPCVVALGCGLILSVRNKVHSYLKNKLLLMSGILFIVQLMTAFWVTPMFSWYLGPSVPFLILTAVYLLSEQTLLKTTPFRGARRFFLLSLCLICLICFAITAIPRIHTPLRHLQLAFVKQDWVPTMIKQMTGQIEDIVKRKGPMLTLAPLLALQARAQIYPELSTAPFHYRYGHLFTEEQKRIMRITDPKTLQKLLKTQPPTAVLVGTEHYFLEEPLLDYATKNDWQMITIRGLRKHTLQGSRQAELKLFLYCPRTKDTGASGR